MSALGLGHGRGSEAGLIVGKMLVELVVMKSARRT